MNQVIIAIVAEVVKAALEAYSRGDEVLTIDLTKYRLDESIDDKAKRQKSKPGGKQ